MAVSDGQHVGRRESRAQSLEPESSVGWVRRGAGTHRIHVCDIDGLSRTINPSYGFARVNHFAKRVGLRWGFGPGVRLSSFTGVPK